MGSLSVRAQALFDEINAADHVIFYAGALALIQGRGRDRQYPRFEIEPYVAELTAAGMLRAVPGIDHCYEIPHHLR